MSLELIIGVGIIAFLLIYIARGLQGDTHLMLQVFLVAIAITLFVVLAKGVYDSKTSCESVLNQTVEYTNATNHTIKDNTYGVHCYSNTASTTSRTIYNIVSWIVIIFDAYMLYMLFFWLITGGAEKILKGLNMKRRKK